MLRDKAGRHCVTGDAVLNIVGCPYTFTAEAADYKHQGTSPSPHVSRIANITRKRSIALIARNMVYPLDQANEPRLLQRQSTICELTFPTTVLAVRMNRKRLAVILEDQIYLYDISNMKLLYTIETSPNPNGTRHTPILSVLTDQIQLYVRFRLPPKVAI